MEKNNQMSKRPRTLEARLFFDDYKLLDRRCQFCAEIIRCDHVGVVSDSRLQRHLEICPARNREISVSDSDETPFARKFDHDLARRLAVKFMVHAELPLKDSSFSGFPLEICHPDFKLPSTAEIHCEIKKLYEEERGVLVEYFKSYTGKIALSYKFWKSCEAGDSAYVAVTAHYIDSDWKLKKRLLGFSFFEDDEDEKIIVKGKSIAKGIAIQIKKWDLTNKVFSITSDNGDSTDVITRYLRKMLPVIGEEDTFFHVRCCARVLNLIAQDGLKEVDSFIERIDSILTDMGNYKSRHEEFLEVFKALGVEYKEIPFYPFADRWDCTYLLLDAVIPYRAVFDRYIVGKQEFAPFSDDDWFLATMIRDFLKVLHDAVTYLARNYYATSSLVLCHILDICLVIEKYPTNPVLSRLCLEVKRKLRSFWEKIPILCGLGSIMDPRLKFRGLEILIKSIYKSGVYDVDNGASDDRLTEINSALEKIFEKYQPQSCSNNVDRSKEVGSSSSQTQDKAWEILLEQLIQSSCDRKSELQCYLDLPCVDGCNEGNAFDILGWWKAHEIIFPVLSTMARDLLTVPMSAVFSVSALETGPFMVDDYRTILSPAMVNYSRCLGDWYRVGGRTQDVPIDEWPINEDDEEDDDEEDEEIDVGKP